MNKYFYFFIFFLFLLSCLNKQNLNKFNKIYLTIKYDSDIKINGYNLLDISSDIGIKYFQSINLREETTDSLKTGKDLSTDLSNDINNKPKKDKNFEREINNKYITDKEKINYYKLKEKEISEIIIKNIKDLSNDYNIKFITEFNKEEINENFILDIIILEYNEGEYNLIENLDTILKIKFQISNVKYNINKIYIKKYKIKAQNSYPTEKSRINHLSKLIVFDIIKFLNYITID